MMEVVKKLPARGSVALHFVRPGDEIARDEDYNV
jgi:hypothetical protein